MEFILIILVVAVIGLWGSRKSLRESVNSLRIAYEKQNAEIVKFKDELSELRIMVTDLGDKLEEITLSPAQREVKRFKRLPFLTRESLVEVDAGTKLSLVLLAYTDAGTPIVYPVEYKHHALDNKSPDLVAVAHGDARLNDSDDFREVRILFPRSPGNAEIRGLTFVGPIKEG
jgi:hypothetical protein